jgi:hypothetical protein
MWCCRAGASPAVVEATGAVALQFAGVDREFAIARLETAGRERGGSAAKSVQRTNVHRVGPYRETMVAGQFANPRCQRSPPGEDRHGKNSRRHEPSSWRQPEQLRAKFCSTALQSIAFLLASNETGSHVTQRLFSSPVRRGHNDLKLQAMSRSQPRGLRNACRLSCSPYRVRGADAQEFSSGGSIIGTTEAEPISSVGMVSIGSIALSVGSSNCGCSTRVASNIAENNNAAAR